MHQAPADLSGPSRGPGGSGLLRESLVALTQDAALMETLAAVAPEHALSYATDEGDLTRRLLGQPTGVALLDAAAVQVPIAQLAEQLRAQFPELVLIVAGGLADQAALSTQVTNGTVYRFLHKPVSAQRVKLFVDAAWRRHDAEIAATGEMLAPAFARAANKPALPRKLFAVVAIAVLAAIGTGWWLLRSPSSAPLSSDRGEAAAPAQAVVQTADPLATLLAQADAALSRGDLNVPPENNATDLYRAVLARSPSNAQALAGLDRVADLMLTRAEQALVADKLDEAQQWTDAARAIQPENVRVSLIAAQIDKEHQRLTEEAALRQSEQKLNERVANLLTQQSAAAPGTGAGAGATAPAAAAVKTPAAAESASAVAATSVPLATAPAAPVAAPASGAAQDSIIAAKQLTRVHSVDPVYPATAERTGRGGSVDLEFTVRADGSVADVIVTDAQPRRVFESAAVAAVRQWRYEPMIRDGHPVDQRVRLRIVFSP